MSKLTQSVLFSLLSATAFAANNSFLPYSGTWNAETNWTYGTPYATDPDNAVIAAYKTCTIEEGTSAEANRIFIGANSPGTLIVNGNLYTPSVFGIDVGLWNNGLGDGQLTIENGGQIGFPNNRIASIRLGGPTSTKGRLQIGSATSPGTAYLNNLYVLTDTTSTGRSSINVENGLLDVLSAITVGYQAGTASNALMTVSGSSTISTALLKIGRNDTSSDLHTSGRLTVTGSEPVFKLGSSLLLANSSVLDLNFDDNGIAPIIAPKFWYSNSATINITGTTNVLPGSYELITGTTGGSTGNSITFSISGFHNRYLTEIVESTNNGAISFSLNITAQHTYDLGACEQQLAWAYDSTDTNRMAKQLDIIDALSDAGADWIRLTHLSAFATKATHIKRCNERGIKVLLQLSAGRSEFYPQGTEKRPGSDPAGQPQWDSYRLSDIDLNLAESYIRSFFDVLIASNATIDAIEMFNEINWNAFNGDLPLVEGGYWIDENTDWNNSTFSQYRAGIEKVAKLTKTVSDLNEEYFGGVPEMITCGMVGASSMNSNWVARVKGGLVSQALTLQLMHGSHPMQTNSANYLQYVDGIGMHIYPNIIDFNEQTTLAEIHEDLDDTLSIPGVGTTKPFWITECGYQRSYFDTETNRYKQLLLFHDALTEYDRPKSAIRTVFHFAFSKECNTSHYVWDDGIADKSIDIFSAATEENATWDRLPFDAWQVENFGEKANDESVSGTLADSDGDGNVNLIEYATGSNPTDPASTPDLHIISGPAITYMARTDDTQLTSTLQKTIQLTPAEWENVTNCNSQKSDTDEYLVFSTQPTNTTGFYRLNITRETN
ncbi:hypothetical protein [Tichowtungia aerotolerans]|uniref:Glycoside hydrolase family 5 domain-containing protein n=1 Tax=Tichowtungia aerotolerans TaxID=2697043 RepID=A0A6P1MA43_9BACT|nr:hypothetical protein [Tichowtungia aerotolerans]QHI70797.1 hypothetical protein GT409_15560 [Tichowtungia aerotolerans]